MITRNRFLYVFIFVVGTGSLGAEIAAVRLMAPFFGASTLVWANTIGVVLAALSVGYWLGGKIADRHPHLRGMCLMVLGASVLLAAIPFVGRPMFNASVSALDQIEAGAFVGSLFGVLLLVAVPVIMLSAAAPYAVRLATSDIEHSGRTTGRIYAVSTAGSLLGTWLSALLLIPLIGTQRTFITFALVIALVAAVGLGWRYMALPAALAAVLALPVGTVKATDDGVVLYETETPEQYVRVIERHDGDRVLELNEGQAIHSLYPGDGGVLTDNVWDGFLVLPFAGLNAPPEQIAILGNGAGTTARAYGHYFPDTEVDGVEIDGELTEIGERFFDLDNPRLTVYHEDARPWLRRIDRTYDVIMLDAYRQPYIPFYLSTTEFFDLVRERLAPGGVAIVNAGHPPGNDDLETVLGRTLDEVFPNVVRDPIMPRNTLLAASDGVLSAERLRAALPELHPDLRPIARASAGRVGPRLPGGSVYTDDRAPVEWLIDRSIIGYAAEGE